MNIRPAQAGDHGSVWAMLEPVFRAGDTYTIDASISAEDAIAYWFARDKETFVAEINEEIVGTYYLKPNQGGGGQHVCNCGYVTASKSAGRGVARAMCEHSQTYARTRGYRGMQFNFVVSSNERAIALWHRLGFETVGCLPLAFAHPKLGYIDAFVMFKPL